MVSLLVTLALALMAPPATAQQASIADRTAGWRRIDGFVPLYWNDADGRLYMELTRFGTEFLYQISLPTGVGSNSLGLDRGQLGDTRVVYFDRVGPRVLLVEPNYRYRAITTNAAERRAVEQSFARSVVWGFDVEAAGDRRVLVDATSFFLRDAHGVADRLRQRGQGRYRLEATRSAFFLPRTKGFPENTEVEVTLTFVAREDVDPGPLVRQTTPSPRAITVRQHHSFVELPDPAEGDYRPRRVDPRVGVSGIEFYDYASSLTEPVERRWIVRHRLVKQDPMAAVSAPVEPIVYYVDNGAPEPIRTALIEGASWWNAAFEAAGFTNGFQVRVLPEDADPMDVRYNVINWVHRATRGWSYGGSVIDPRTGEILKGNVTLGSLRVRQDYLIGTALAPPEASDAAGGAAPPCLFGLTPNLEYLQAIDPSADAEAMSLARIRQLAAHEVGHTLGFAHNFAASTYGRASVMDYPAPLVRITGGRIDLSDAYATGIGAYDRFAVQYAYSQFPPGVDERPRLEAIVNDAVDRGMLFLTDADSRPAGAAHPLANLWDNGADPVAMLRHEMEVRRLGLARFGLRNIAVGTPLSVLEEKLLPLYLHHRYQLTAAAKSVGGAYYTYAVRTPAGPSPARVFEIVPPGQQREALDAVLDTIDVKVLEIPRSILNLIPPRAFRYGGGTAEPFAKHTAMVFDPIAAATIAADLAISALLQYERAARLIDFHARDGHYPGFEEVVGALMARTWGAVPPGDPHEEAILQAIQRLTVTRLMDLAANDAAAPQVRAIATDALRDLAARLRDAGSAHDRAARDDIRRFLDRPDRTHESTRPPDAPPGDPIGAATIPWP